LVDFSASEFYVPMFQNTLSVPSSYVVEAGRMLTPPMKMEQSVLNVGIYNSDARESPSRKNTTSPRSLSCG